MGIEEEGNNPCLSNACHTANPAWEQRYTVYVSSLVLTLMQGNEVHQKLTTQNHKTSVATGCL